MRELPGAGFFANVRQLLATLLETAEVRLQLLGTELEQEKRRVFAALVLAAVALVCLALALVMLSVLVLLIILILAFQFRQILLEGRVSLKVILYLHKKLLHVMVWVVLEKMLLWGVK